MNQNQTLLSWLGFGAFTLAPLIATLGGCQSTKTNPSAPDATVTSGLDATASEFARLIARNWTVPPGKEIYRCRRELVTRDMYVAGFDTISPVGTHHTVLTISDSGTPGDYDCDSNIPDPKMLYASGVGTLPTRFPTGVAIKLKAGQILNINLHLFNTSDQALSGESGVSVKEIKANELVNEAEMFFAGTFALNIPGDGTTTVQSGDCTLAKDATIFSLWPHMHQTGTRQKINVTTAGTTMTLLDSPYDFNDQKFYPMATPVSLKAGDNIHVDCTFVNNTGSTINFGDSSKAEMCFAGLYRYPVNPQGNLFECVAD
jgi:Copper type II ascorbate-dependent monooxygenase, C-terminal domain